MSRSWRRLLLPGLMTALMLAVLVGLGTWQVQRLLWKTEVLGEIARAESAPAIDLPATPPAFAKVRASGQLRSGPTALMGAEVRTLPTGPTMGARLIAVLDRGSAQPLLVDLGWVPTKATPALPAGPVTIEGFVHPGEAASWFSASDDRAQRHVYTLDPRVIAELLGVQAAPFVLVALGPTPATGWPDPARHLPRPPNNHLIYAATWYGFALTLIIIFAVWAIRNHRA